MDYWEYSKNIFWSSDLGEMEHFANAKEPIDGGWWMGQRNPKNQLVYGWEIPL